MTRKWPFPITHIQQGGLTLQSYCGRRVGTPGGRIYPGVYAKMPQWFTTHPFPDAIGPVCQTCQKLLAARAAMGG